MRAKAARRGRRALEAVVLAGLGAACAPPPPPPPPAPPPPPPPFEFPYDTVWSAEAVALRADSGSVPLPRPFTPLEVVEADPDSLLVRCGACPGTPSGRIGASEAVFAPLRPEDAAGEGIAEFALAVREAARRHDLAALRPVMAPDFTFSFLGTQGAEQALAAWESERFAPLDGVAALLDRGLATRDGALWVAPPEHLDALDYRGERIGFRRTLAGRWEWVFLVRSEVPAG